MLQGDLLNLGSGRGPFRSDAADRLGGAVHR